MKIINYLNRIIEFSFYLLFLLVPLVFSSSPSELFEFPKMWLTFGLTIVIVTFWIVKMILQRRILIQRTPLDIPLLLFLTSQIVSTLYSLDPHVSLWGYYSRFNGGLLSTISYVLLYYAFVSNFSNNVEVKKPNGLIYSIFAIGITLLLSLSTIVMTGLSFLSLSVFLTSSIFFLSTWYLPGSVAMRTISISLISGSLVALWGFPSHFGYDPTCFIFRGSFDTSCWTEAFKPTIRIFSTLGQPAWLAAYLSILIPLAISYFLISRETQDTSSTKNQESRIKNYGNPKKNYLTSYFLLLTSLLFYACLTYTDTRGGFIGFWIANLIFWGLVYFKKILSGKNFLKYFLIFNLLFLIFNFLQGIPISQISKFTYPELNKTQSSPTVVPKPAAGELGGTDSGKIRLLVWQGAIDIWQDNPIIGTGVETYAFAYYKYKPVAHNLTSEWDYLYNKAHNEYLNYLATTGIFGLGSYLAIIGTFLFLCLKHLKIQNSKFKTTTQNSKIENLENSLEIGNWKLEIALIASYISILVSNFFGFSVVIINLYFFLIPAFVFILGNFLSPDKALVFPNNKLRAENQELRKKENITALQWILIALLLLTSYFLLLTLVRYWNADINYAIGSNLDKAGSYQEATKPLQNAVEAKPNEPVYKDELSINLGTLAAALYLQKDASSGAQLARDAISLSDQVVANHPNDVVFWKNRVRLFYTLAQGDTAHEKNYLDQALKAIKKTQELAPNDAKISYNYAVLAGQIKTPQKGIEILENTIKLKPDYRDAYFALGLYFHQLATDKDGNVVDSALQKKAVDAYNYILKNLDPNDKQIKDSLKSWEK